MKSKFKINGIRLFLFHFCLLLVLQSVVKLGESPYQLKNGWVETSVDLETESESEENTEENKLEWDADYFLVFNRWMYDFNQDCTYCVNQLKYWSVFLKGIEFPPEINGVI